MQQFNVEKGKSFFSISWMRRINKSNILRLTRTNSERHTFESNNNYGYLYLSVYPCSY